MIKFTKPFKIVAPILVLLIVAIVAVPYFSDLMQKEVSYEEAIAKDELDGKLVRNSKYATNCSDKEDFLFFEYGKRAYQLVWNPDTKDTPNVNIEEYMEWSSYENADFTVVLSEEQSQIQCLSTTCSCMTDELWVESIK